MSVQIPHSAQVRMVLHLEGNDFPLSQMADEWIILRTPFPTEITPAEARITITVDARRKTFPIFLPQGIANGQRRITIGAAQEELVEA